MEELARLLEEEARAQELERLLEEAADALEEARGPERAAELAAHDRARDERPRSRLAAAERGGGPAGRPR